MFAPNSIQTASPLQLVITLDEFNRFLRTTVACVCVGRTHTGFAPNYIQNASPLQLVITLEEFLDQTRKKDKRNAHSSPVSARERTLDTFVHK